MTPTSPATTMTNRCLPTMRQADPPVALFPCRGCCFFVPDGCSALLDDRPRDWRPVCPTLQHLGPLS